MRRGIVVLAAALVVSACGRGDAVPENVVTIDSGKVKGAQSDGVLRFQGIPYAAKPQRWMPPQAVQKWDGVREATKPGSPCPQVGSSYAQTKSTDEDCLSVNVTTPGTQGKKPVIVWVHGDGAVGAGHYFDAARLAKQGDVVVVTFNYRMGVFGGFGFPGLKNSGEFGLLDQRAAFEWVRRNAGSFGGDTGNVTAFGVSFGATAISAHLMGKPSFDKAIMHSSFTLVDVPKGAWYPGLEALPSLSWRPKEEIEGLGAMIGGELGCTDVECLRQLPVEKLLGYEQIMNIFQPMGYGGDLLPKLPGELLEAGRFAEMPILVGATRDEHNSFVGLFRQEPMSAEQYAQLVQDAFPEQAAAIIKEYPASAFQSPKQAWATVLTDRVWARATFRQNELYAKKAPTYAFEFADRNAATNEEFPKELHGANHSSDIDYLFPDADFTKDRGLSDQMIKMWTDFARSGSPGWPKFSEGKYVQSLAPGAIGRVDYAAEHKLDFWK